MRALFDDHPAPPSQTMRAWQQAGQAQEPCQVARGPVSVNDLLEAVRPRTPLPSAFSIYETTAGSPQSPSLPHF